MALLSVEEYRQALASLAPSGLVWPRDPESTFQRLLASWAQTFERLDTSALQLIGELNPAYCHDLGLLNDWLRITQTENRSELIGTFAAVGGASAAYFISLAAAMGIQISIDEFQPFTCLSPCTNAAGEQWPFVFGVRVHGATHVAYFDCTSACNASISGWGIEALERLIQRLKPAHTHAIFSYGS